MHDHGGTKSDEAFPAKGVDDCEPLRKGPFCSWRGTDLGGVGELNATSSLSFSSSAASGEWTARGVVVGSFLAESP